MICKYNVKMFKILNLGVDNDVIVCGTCTKHKIQHAISMAHYYTWISQQTTELHIPSNVANPNTIKYVKQDNVICIYVDEEHVFFNSSRPCVH